MGKRTTQPGDAIATVHEARRQEPQNFGFTATQADRAGLSPFVSGGGRASTTKAKNRNTKKRKRKKRGKRDEKRDEKEKQKTTALVRRADDLPTHRSPGKDFRRTIRPSHYKGGDARQQGEEKAHAGRHGGEHGHHLGAHETPCLCGVAPGEGRRDNRLCCCCCCCCGQIAWSARTINVQML